MTCSPLLTFVIRNFRNNRQSIMSRRNLPQSTLQLSNVAVVRLKKFGIRFEIACYKNKIIAWKKGVEKDIDEVLQTDLVFTNVSKGQEAKKDDLIKAFGTDNRAEICKMILSKGEAQISEKERNIRNESQYKEIAKIVAEKTYNTETKRPFPAIEIENEMKECHFSMKPNKSAKQQALELIKVLRDRIPIERAQMRLCAELKTPSTTEKCKKLAIKVETTEMIDEKIKIQFLIDPGSFKEVEALIQADQGNLEIVDFKNVIDTDEEFE